MSDEVTCACGCGAVPPPAKRTRADIGHKRGVPTKYINGHNSNGASNGNWGGGKSISRGYVFVRDMKHPRAKNGYVEEHILVAEKAIGMYLPDRAVVHHANEVKSENRNSNLVICEDRAYHNLLHQRMRALTACGNATWRSCNRCHAYDDPASLYVSPNGGTVFHRSCSNDHRRSHGIL